MNDRKYTVAEIDWMRDAIEHQWLYGRKRSEPDPGATSGVDKHGNLWFSTSTMSRSYMEDEKTKSVEELLRTYILAGIEPKDLD